MSHRKSLIVMGTWSARGEGLNHVTLKPRGSFVVTIDFPVCPRCISYSPNIFPYFYFYSCALRLYLYAQLIAHYVTYPGTIPGRIPPPKPHRPLNSFLRRCLSCHQLSGSWRREHQQHSQSQLRQYIFTTFKGSFLKLIRPARYSSSYPTYTRLFTTQAHSFSSRCISHNSQTFLKISSSLCRRCAYSIRAA